MKRTIQEAIHRHPNAPLALATACFALFLTGCRDPSIQPRTEQSPLDTEPEVPVIGYVGSSTIGNFIQEAELVYRKARFLLDTEPESVGGEQAIQDGLTDLAGIAAEPQRRTRDANLRATHLGTDTLVVLVHPDNPVSNVTRAQLKELFTGGVTNWKQLGGPDLEVVPFAVGEQSATRRVFRNLVLGAEDYSGAQVVRPDAHMPRRIEAEPGGIGAVSSSFLCSGGSVRVLSVESQAPLIANLDYPLVRPLYLVWNPESPEVTAFMAWIGTDEGQDVLTKCFGDRRPLP